MPSPPTAFRHLGVRDGFEVAWFAPPTGLRGGSTFIEDGVGYHIAYDIKLAADGSTSAATVRSPDKTVTLTRAGAVWTVDDVERPGQARFRFRPLPANIVNLAESFVAQRERRMVFGESPARQLQRCCANPAGFGPALGGAQHFKFIAEDAPEVFLTLHAYQPSLNWLTRRTANSSAARGRAWRSSEVISGPTKKLVVPITSLEGVKALPPWRETSE